MAKSILVADDSPTLRKVVELTFSVNGFHDESVDGGDAVLRSLAAPRPDSVIADGVVPEPSGHEICRRLKRSEHLVLERIREPQEERD
jgi:DNA-binding response OmpR family regulator